MQQYYTVIIYNSEYSTNNDQVRAYAWCTLRAELCIAGIAEATAHRTRPCTSTMVPPGVPKG
jgi:hypothetical protein